MSVIEITEAKREGARVVLGLSGVSSSGKTHTALLVALGLAKGNPRKIGFICTENRRGRLYADVFSKLEAPHRTDEPFLIGDLMPPFSPQRYIDAIHEFQKRGVEVLIIDSVTHEWEGQGGCQEIAEAGNPKLPNWNKAKSEHKRFMNAMLQCDMHIITCIRAREKSKPEKVQKDGKTTVEFQDQGLQPITEKNFMFELTVSAMVHDQGTRREILKCPSDLRAVFDTKDKYIGVQQGRALRDWIDGAGQLNPEVEKHRNALQSITEQGVAALGEAWAKVPQPIRVTLGDVFKDTLKAAAAEFDKLRADAAKAEAANAVPALATPGDEASTNTPATALTASAPADGVDPANESALQSLQTKPAEPATTQAGAALKQIF